MSRPTRKFTGGLPAYLQAQPPMMAPWCVACVKRLAFSKASAAAASAAMKVVAATRQEASPSKRRRADDESASSAPLVVPPPVDTPDGLDAIPECSGGQTCGNCKKAKKGCEPVSVLSCPHPMLFTDHLLGAPSTSPYGESPALVPPPCHPASG